MTADGSLIAVAELKRVHLINPQPWQDDVFDLPASIRYVAIATRTKEVTVALADGRLMSAAAGKPPRTTGTYPHILAVRSTMDGGTRALVRTADGIAVVDPATGSTVGIYPVDLPSFNLSGALRSDGRTVAVVGADRRLRFGPIDSPRQTGQFVPDTLSSLAILTPDTLLFASAQFGTQVYDGTSGLTTARLTTPESGAAEVRVAPSSGLILTYVGHLVFTWSPFGLTTIPEPNTIQNKGTGTHATRRGVDVVGTAGGDVIINRGDRIHAVHGAVTAVAVGDDDRSVLVGSDRGEVVEIDLNPGIVVRHWQAPDNAPVTVLGWAKRPEQMLIGTAAGRWWTAAACNGCGSDTILLAQIRLVAWLVRCAGRRG